MLAYPHIDPVAFSIGPLHVHWYGLMYVVGIGLAWWLARRRAESRLGLTVAEVEDLVFYCALGVILGGRLGYTLFYNLQAFLEHPLLIFRIWEGGMSFHGGLLGVIIAMLLFGHKMKLSFFALSDFVGPLVPIGLGAGRIGNFINGELWGKPTDLPWAMAFPGAGDDLPRHPSMLYEAILEGPVLFTILNMFILKPRPRMATSGLFLLFYGLFRFLVEFVRLPDPQLGYLAFGWLTMGQVLSFPMILLGVWLVWQAYRRDEA